MLNFTIWIRQGTAGLYISKQGLNLKMKVPHAERKGERGGLTNAPQSPIHEPRPFIRFP